MLEQTFLLFEIFGGEQRIHSVAHFGHAIDVVIHEPGKCSAGTAEIEGFAAALSEQGSFAIPKTSGLVSQVRTKLMDVHGTPLGKTALAK